MLEVECKNGGSPTTPKYANMCHFGGGGPVFLGWIPISHTKQLFSHHIDIASKGFAFVCRLISHFHACDKELFSVGKIGTNFGCHAR